MDLKDLPNIMPGALQPLDHAALAGPGDPGHPPRILLLYGSLRPVSYSRLCAEEGARVLRALGCETRIFDPSGLPLPDDGVDETHPKVAELRELVLWSEGMVWSSPERHGAMTAIMKAQIDWLPLSPIGGIRPTQGKTLAVMQVSGGSQSFNTVNQLRILGRWMRLITIPNQSSVPMAFKEFEGGRMKPSPLYNRIVDVMEELARFTLMTRARDKMLTDRYSERVETLQDVHDRVSG
ncbi:MAG: arsenical resistance protein ArsH [Loktanella sp.]|nr:arsenical resistance protein ArsH [Loktanella sp.]